MEFTHQNIDCRRELPTLDLADVNPQPQSSLFEDLAQLHLAPVSPATATGSCGAAEVAWGARVATSVNPLVTTAASLGPLMRLCGQALAGGNPHLAARVLRKTRGSPLLPGSPAVRHHLAFLELEGLRCRGEAGTAVSGLSSLVRGEILPVLRSAESPSPGRAVPLVQLACWLEDPGEGGGVPGVGLEDCPEEYAALLPGLDDKWRLQLSLLIATIEVAPQLAVAWASLGNWLHARLTEVAEVLPCVSRNPRGEVGAGGGDAESTANKLGSDAFGKALCSSCLCQKSASVCLASKKLSSATRANPGEARSSSRNETLISIYKFHSRVSLGRPVADKITPSLQESPWKSTLQDLAVKASCQRLATAATPNHLPHLAAPELLRVLKVVEGCSSMDLSMVERIPSRLWQAVVPQLFSHLAGDMVSRLPVVSVFIVTFEIHQVWNSSSFKH